MESPSSQMGQVEIKVACALDLLVFFASGQLEDIRLDGEVVPSGRGMWKWLGKQMVGTQGEEGGWHLPSKQDPYWVLLEGGFVFQALPVTFIHH